MTEISALDSERRSALSTGKRIGEIVWIAAAIFLAFLAISFLLERHWPLVHDAPLIHYVVFLMDHGRAPYRDIIEMNMPGSYILEQTVMHTLGGSAGAWVAWDAITGIIAVLACMWIAGPERRAAGIIAGVLAYLIHANYGPMDLGQRDWFLAVSLLLAWGFLFAAERSGRPQWMAGAMCFFGLAASIKPPVVLIAVALLIVVCVRLRSRSEVGRWLAWSIAGGLLPTIMVAAFLLRWGATQAFFAMLRGLVPWYASLARQGVVHLAFHAVPPLALPLTAGAFILLLATRSWRLRETWLLLSGVAAGFLLYVVQAKGWTYHRYTLVAFLPLWALIEIDRGLRGKRFAQTIAGATLLMATLAMAPLLLAREKTGAFPFGLESQHELQYSMSTIDHLQDDLNRLGGSSLSGHIQCLDMDRGGCINVLYRMKLVQSTGFIYDYYLFPEKAAPVTDALQARFLREMTAAPPRVIVLSSHTWPGESLSYDQIQRWPAFGQFLASRYELTTEYAGDRARNIAGYRIYTLKNPERAGSGAGVGS